MIKNKNILIAYTIATLIPFNISAKDANYDYHEPVANSIITEQRVSLEKILRVQDLGHNHHVTLII